MQPDASKLSIPLLIALSAVPVVLSVGISYGVGTTQVSTLRERVESIETKQEEISKMSERLARVETKIDFLVDLKRQRAQSVTVNP